MTNYRLSKVLIASTIYTLLFISCSVDRGLRTSRGGYDDGNRYDHGRKRTIKTNNYISGICSYYGQKFQGKKTANGEIFDMYKLTAAHKSLPFGTLLKVTNLRNSRTVVVRINDRGPFVMGRELDISYAAAKNIGLLSTGTTKFSAEIIYIPKKK